MKSSNKIFQENYLYEEEIIDFVDQLINAGVENSASDIHIEPCAEHYRIRLRCDGILYEKMTLKNTFALKVITRLKVIAKLDITEQRFPQDGRFQNNNMDIRINSCPTIYGEKIVLRLLYNNFSMLNIENIGLTDLQKKIFLQYLSYPQGMIIITGPTSSGKSLTLYSAINHLNQNKKNITTIEDPVEIRLNGINQINIQTKINLDFSHILRAILRQDPDIIMIGEIRDQETAQIAVQAANTGHLVLTTLHTKNTIETIPRLISLGISTHQITNSVSLIIAQRLIRKLCVLCKKPTLSNQTIYQAVGCENCLDGYLGRTGIFEFLQINEHTLKTILNNSTPLDKCDTLLGVAQQKLLLGITSQDEINRVIMI